MKKSLILGFCAAALLSACGGGGDAPAQAPDATQDASARASASVAGLLSYVGSLVATTADTLEPVEVGAVTPPKDDTAEPTPVD